MDPLVTTLSFVPSETNFWLRPCSV